MAGRGGVEGGGGEAEEVGVAEGRDGRRCGGVPRSRANSPTVRPGPSSPTVWPSTVTRSRPWRTRWRLSAGSPSRRTTSPAATWWGTRSAATSRQASAPSPLKSSALARNAVTASRSLVTGGRLRPPRRGAGAGSCRWWSSAGRRSRPARRGRPRCRGRAAPGGCGRRVAPCSSCGSSSRRRRRPAPCCSGARHADRRDAAYALDVGDELLDDRRVDVLPGFDDDLLDPPGDEERPAREVAEVPGVQPAVDRPARRWRRARRGSPRTASARARGSRRPHARRTPPVRGHHAHFGPGQRRADPDVLDRAGRGRQRGDARPFERRAVHRVDHRRPPAAAGT